LTTRLHALRLPIFVSTSALARLGGDPVKAEGHDHGTGWISGEEIDRRRMAPFVHLDV
jgi:hypothetical protein